ncbi:MAG: tetratricopeptide repeat protein [Pseudomonadota bacterium]
MDSYRTEDEQVEALKRWWKENGQSTVIGIVLALGLGFGWQAWQRNEQVTAENASTLYQQMLQALATQDERGADAGRALALQLKDEYRGTAYAQFASLHLARLAVLEGQEPEAEKELRWVLSMADAGSELHQVAQLRLARVLAAQGQADSALALLENAETDFVASYAMARGDILLGDGREDDALAAYESAVASLDADSPIPQTLQDKLQYLTARRMGSEGGAG